jgi:hypothetical protein
MLEVDRRPLEVTESGIFPVRTLQRWWGKFGNLLCEVTPDCD